MSLELPLKLHAKICFKIHAQTLMPNRRDNLTAKFGFDRLPPKRSFCLLHKRQSQNGRTGMPKLILFAVIISAALNLHAQANAQSTFDLEPPIHADSAQVALSPDPDAIPVFRFATAEVDESGQIRIATKSATQTLVAPMPGPVDPEIDPRGIPYTEKVTQNYTVHRVVKEKDKDGKEVRVTKAETRSRVVPVTRYRKRNEEQQAEFEKKVAEHKAKEKDSGNPEAAVATKVEQEYTVNVPERIINENGDVTMQTKAQTRTRTITVYRGETKTDASVSVKTWAMDKVQCFDVSGEALDLDVVKDRLSERQPVILVSSEQGISPYFEKLLNPEAILIVTPSK